MSHMVAPITAYKAMTHTCARQIHSPRPPLIMPIVIVTRPMPRCR